jgi:hypothetical protein
VLKAARTVQAKAKRRSLREASGVAGWGSNPYVSDDEDSLEEEDGEVPYFSVVDFDEEVRKFASLQVQPPLRLRPSCESCESGENSPLNSMELGFTPHAVPQ